MDIQLIMIGLLVVCVLLFVLSFVPSIKKYLDARARSHTPLSVKLPKPKQKVVTKVVNTENQAEHGQIIEEALVLIEQKLSHIAEMTDVVTDSIGEA